MTWTTLQRSRLSQHIYGWTGGQGVPLLLVHGVGMRADYWSNIIPALEKYFALTVVDMPGHGDSPVLDEQKPTLNQYTDFIAEVLQALREPMYVAGHSMGAMISVDLADRYASHVRAIAVLNGIFERVADATAAVRLRADNLDGKTVSDPSPTLARWFGDKPTGVDAQAANCCRDWLNTINPLGYQQAYQAFAYDDGPTADTVKNLNCPALFTTGELEPNSTAEMSEAMAQLAPLGECHIVEGAKHMMSMTHGDEVSIRMTDFFNRVGGLE